MANSAYINIDSKSFNRENKLNLILEGTDPKTFFNEVYDKLKFINENFFYNKLIITSYDESSSFSISDDSEHDRFPIYVSRVKGDREYQIEFSHKQRGKFMWYVNWVMLKELAIHFGQNKIYDEGVGDIPISGMNTHTSSKDLKTLQDNIYKAKDWDKEALWYGNDEMVKFFKLDRTSKLKKFIKVSKEVIKFTNEIRKLK